ncbi:HIT family protein [Roseinatronobacter alkalisoli]|uniref:HIT domain-containing protein n=1 Tax=Roseinatronobacter alkalisoli TaxID=3028235 RepID=A0ABT5T6H0_9RHOB|nr:HIT domain-containing protein [Roseinatronobacter sp. HJB301]MDD7970706.1 HIT domain-containing protein [Roseinatronobacter sp. HJB301]
MQHDCLFCKIASGALPAHKIYEDDHILAFLDLHPIRAGHSLVIPKTHHVWFEDLPEHLATRITTCAQKIARAQKAIYKVPRVSMFYTGIHVPHAHAHVVPMHHMHDVTSSAYLHDGATAFSTPPQGDARELTDTATIISEHLIN